jgi:hypothetical protein
MRALTTSEIDSVSGGFEIHSAYHSGTTCNAQSGGNYLPHLNHLDWCVKVPPNDIWHWVYFGS